MMAVRVHVDVNIVQVGDVRGELVVDALGDCVPIGDAHVAIDLDLEIDAETMTQPTNLTPADTVDTRDGHGSRFDLGDQVGIDGVHEATIDVASCSS